MSTETKRWLVSTAVTFAAGFFGVLVLNIDSLDLASLQSGALAGVLFAAVRAGVKAAAELFLAWYANK